MGDQKGAEWKPFTSISRTGYGPWPFMSPLLPVTLRNLPYDLFSMSEPPPRACPNMRDLALPVRAKHP